MSAPGAMPGGPGAADVRWPAVAGSFYPREPGRLRALVASLLEAAVLAVGSRGADGVAGALPLGVLVPHAGLEYSGITASAGWACLGGGRPVPPTAVILGTNHSAAWLQGVGAWAAGSWAIPGGFVAIDEPLADEVVALRGPFAADPAAHLREHSIEVQLPLLAAVAPGARVVPLAVGCGTGARAIAAGERLGRLLAARRAAGDPVVLVISSDMAHYPPAATSEAVTEELRAVIEALDPERLASLERGLRAAGIIGLDCGMCGIEPAVLGLAALRATGAVRGTTLHASTSADAGGPADRTVGYLAVRFDA